jgi:hypothetical protein
MSITKAGTTVVGTRWHEHFKFVSASALDITFSGGKWSNGLGDITNITTNTTLNLPDNAASKIYIDFNSAVIVALHDSSHNNKLLIYEIITEAGVVIDILDRRAIASSIIRERTLPDRQGNVLINHAIFSGAGNDGNTATTIVDISYADFLDKWHFFVMTKEAGVNSRKMYLDGTELAVDRVDFGVFGDDAWLDSLTSDGSSWNFTVGKERPSSTQEYYDGWVANIGFLEEVLTPLEIVDLQNATSNSDFESKLSSKNLDHYYSMQEAALPVVDQGTWAVLKDLSGSFGTPDFQQDGPHEISDGSWYSIRFTKSSVSVGEYITTSTTTSFSTNFSNRDAGSYFCWFKPTIATFIGDSRGVLPAIHDTSVSVPNQFRALFERIFDGSPT